MPFSQFPTRLWGLVGLLCSITARILRLIHSKHRTVPLRCLLTHNLSPPTLIRTLNPDSHKSGLRFYNYIIQRMFCKWNHAVCNFLGLTFSLSIVLLHSGYCRSEYPIPFYGVVFHCVDIPQLDNCSPGEGHLGCIQIPCYCVVFRCMDISQSYTHSLGEGHLGCIEVFTLWIRLL